MSFIKKLVRNIVLREKASPKKFVAYLRRKGVRVGENVRFFSPSHTLVDLTYPWLLSIGSHVTIAHGVVILTHDGAWLSLKRCPECLGSICGGQAPVTIGNNVFIGVNAIITKGVTIGDNVIIGVGSVVTKNCDSNCVYAGVPAKKIMTTEEYYLKRKAIQFAEARELALHYRKVFNQEPPKEIFREYFMLFCDDSEVEKTDVFLSKMQECLNPDDSFKYLQNTPPMFPDYESFLEACYK